MLDELTKIFFDTFGIEKRCEFDKYCEDCKTCGCYHYPRLTDRRLLELICINPLCVEFIRPKDISELKNIIIKYFIDNLKSYAEPSEAEIFKQQVQALFKEER